jgi:A/G-specific adenine glycosylase
LEDLSASSQESFHGAVDETLCNLPGIRLMSMTGYQQIRVELLEWFALNQRKLPWRRHYKPYEIWISEIMLQQTQVKTMLPYYHRWLQRFPHVQAVALAQEEDLLKQWEGLGYYSRARNIHRTAKVLLKEHDSEFPRDCGRLRGFPGIGRYTAGAIMSIAFNADCPVVDGNIARTLSRLFDIAQPIRDSQTEKVLWKLAEELLPRGKARSFNQALMDLGAVVCTPRNPSCSQCPIHTHCRALQTGVVNLRPVVKRGKDAVPIHVAVGILVQEGRIFIQKRPPSGLMPHLWEFPGGKILHGETPEGALVREFREELELNVRPFQEVALIRHSYTSFRVALRAFACRLECPGQQPVLHSAVDGRWVTPEELDLYAFPAANRKLIQRIQAEPFSQPD